MSLATKKEEQAIHECYRRLYRASTPSANFDELIQNASENELGEKVIDYNNYEICEYQFSEIIQEVIKEYKIKNRAYVCGPSINILSTTRAT